jgi:antitoxin MazE
MKTRLIRIGNSRGVRIPKPLIEEAGLREEVEVRVSESSIVITSPARTRAGWAESAQRLRAAEADRLLETAATRFDEEEWRWR